MIEARRGADPPGAERSGARKNVFVSNHRTNGPGLSGPEDCAERAEDVLPADQPVGKEIDARPLLDADELGLVLVKGGVDGARIDPTTVLAAGRRHHLLGAGIETVLVGKNLDRTSVMAWRASGSAQQRQPIATSDLRIAHAGQRVDLPLERRVVAADPRQVERDVFRVLEPSYSMS